MTASKDLVTFDSPTANHLLNLKNQRPSENQQSVKSAGGPTIENPEAEIKAGSTVSYDTTVASTRKVDAQPMNKLKDTTALGEEEKEKKDKEMVDEAELDIKDLKDDVNFLSLNLSKLVEAAMVKKDEKEKDTVHIDIGSHNDDDKEDKKGNKNTTNESVQAAQPMKGLKEEEKPEDKEKVAESDDNDDDDKKEKVEESLKLRIDFSEGSKLFQESTTLTEAEKAQAKSLFESAVRSVAQSLAEQIQEAYQGYLVTILEKNERETAKKVDAHLNYVVEEWRKENAVPLENKFKTQFNESFLGKLKTLFEEHYVDIPSGKEDFVQSLVEEKNSIAEQLKLSEAKNVELHAATKEDLDRAQMALVKEHKARLIAEASIPVVASERGKFSTRALTLEFKNTKSFKQDLIALREQYEVADKIVTERQLDVPNATPSFEPSTTNASKGSIEDMYGSALDRLAGTK